MASDEGEDPRGEEGAKEPHVSFVQRLQRHFGREVDPRISLQAEDEKASEKPGSSGSTTPTSVEDFVKRLTPKVEAGSRYEIKQEVASGGMGTILRVWDEDLRRNLAMKVMHGRGTGSSAPADGSGSQEVDPERLGRFLEEAQITGQLDHPGVVPVHDLGIDSKGRCFFTMRFVRGRELKDVLDLAREGKEGWTRTKVLGVILKVCEAMAYAHSKGVVHRDLKPSNVMVGRFGETYVMDWGLARVLGRRDSHDLRLKPQPGDASALSLVRTVRHDEVQLDPDSMLVTMDGDVVGTPSYMSPEQARGKLEEVGPRSDVYSLGSILYYMLTGQTPYVKPGERLSPHTVLTRVLDAAPTPVEKLVPAEPPELVAICQKAMAREAEQRYGSMLEVADDIQAFLENRVVRAYERGSVAEFKKWVVRNKGMAAGVAGMVTLSIASALGFALQKQSENESLSKKEVETVQAKDAAERNEAHAKESEKQAKDSLELADQRRVEADKQTVIARTNEERALRSGYAANILAADYSLKLNDLAEARERLSATEAKLRGFEWRHLQLLANAELADLGNFGNVGVEALAFDPRGGRALLLTGQGRVKVRDLATLREVAPENIQVAGKIGSSLLKLVSGMAMDVSADGARLVIAGEGNNLHVFDLESGGHPPGVPEDGLAGHNARASAVAFSPNGRQLASGDVAGDIVLRDALTGEIQCHLIGHLEQITSLAWSPGSERLASSSHDGTLRTWDCAKGAELHVLRGHHGTVNAVAWDLSGEHLFSCGDDGAVNMWEVESGRLVRNFMGHEGAVLALDYDLNRGALASGSADHTVRVWDVLTGSATILRGHESAVQHVAFSPDGEFVLSSEKEGRVYLWDSRGDLTTTEFALHRAAVNALAFSPDGRRLASASDDQEVVLWDATTGEPRLRLRDHKGMVNSVVFSSDGRTLLSGSQDKYAFLWDAITGKRLKIYGPFERWVESAVLTPDDTRLLVCTGDRKVRLLDGDTMTVLHELGGFQFSIEALALDPTGKRFATVARDIQVWDLEGDFTKALFTLDGRYTTAVFSPDGTRLAGSKAGQIELWDAATGAKLASGEDQKRHRILCLAFSPDGKRLATGSDAGLIHVCDALSLDTLLVLRESQGAVQALAFSPDGARLAAGMKSGVMRVYETTPPAERRALARTASALSDQARAHVEEVFARKFFLADVLRELEGDPDLSQALRESALRLAQLRGDDPVPLFARTIQECLDADGEKELYALALERANAAQRLASGKQSSGIRVNGGADGGAWQMSALSNLALGLACYRSAKYAEAERYLVQDARPPQSEEKSVLFGKREQTLRLLFLCMSECQTAHSQEAERNWRVTQQIVLNDVELAQRPELQGLLAEVETLVRSSGTPAGS